MRHMNYIILTKPIKGLPKLMVTEEFSESNDQILTLKQLEIKDGLTQYRIVAVTSRCQNNHMKLAAIQKWAKIAGGILT